MVWAAVAIGGISVATSVAGGLMAKSDAKEAARLQAMQTAEIIRRQKRSDKRQLGQARAAAYASNIMVSREGSTAAYIQDMKDEQFRGIEWMQRSGDTSQASILAGGNNALMSGLVQGAGTAASTAIGYWGTKE